MATQNVKSISFGGDQFNLYPSNLTSETLLENQAQDATETADRVYPVRMDAHGKLAVNVPWESNTAGTITVSGTITNTSGTYSGTFVDSRITAGMKCECLELGTPEIFGEQISVTAGNGSITISCNSVAGTSTFAASFLGTAVTSTEYETLDENKADKVASATNGNFAGLDAYGNLTDSGHKHSDYVIVAQQTLTDAQKEQVQQNLNVPDKSVTDTINRKIADIGEIINGSAEESINIPTGGLTGNIGYITLPAGSWVIMCSGWAPNESGILNFGNATTGVNSSFTFNLVEVVKISSQQTIYLTYTNWGSSVITSVVGLNIKAMRVM